MATYLSTSGMPPGEMVELIPPDQPTSMPEPPRPALERINPEVGWTTSTDPEW